MNQQIRIIVTIGFLLIGSSIGFFLYLKSNKTVEPPFKKEGQLALIKQNSNRTLKIIDIEIADNNEERTRGLMWRRSMLDSQGMLFVYHEEKPRSFWMKNTYMPLDIIYINRSGTIVSIRSGTTPLSIESIMSDKPAQYALEVNAGFCVKYQINEGDRIKF